MSKTSVTKTRSMLDAYELGDFFLASPKRTIMGKGIFSVVDEAPKTKKPILGLAARVEEALEQAKRAGHPYPIAMGAVPFDYSEYSEIIIPKEVDLSGPLDITVEQRGNFSYMHPYEMQPIPEPEEYMDGVNQGLGEISLGHIDKIVVSRALDFKTGEQVDVKQLLKNLAQYNKQGYTFAVDLSEEKTLSKKKRTANGKRTLIGASPELLVSKNGKTLFANPLAGSRPRSDDPEEDQRRALELLNSEKDLYEHAVVVDMVREALTPFCETIEVPTLPSLIKTDAMWHLSTEIYGTLKQANTSSLELAITLHPTPAVCGYPTSLARDAIYEIEPFDRGFFTGMVGWCDANGDGEWIVTIRCAEVKERSMRLFAGAGVVAGSKAEEELNETEAKFRTMLHAMGIKD
ncbi:isochorismate synthase DhbC [Bacillus sp. J14TS2]|uniref:isochorismate synthase DhbC n=1 Tax=Bacillus sp. J14TS2 TaxID=2807188 RepID=UPI001B285AD2|nr:isochorismate synthase DhbC [Bacillus sp. J14TS2]GIN72152.1 isochorismate synthase DhbC [Bacillus sp. J14TS2]